MRAPKIDPYALPLPPEEAQLETVGYAGAATLHEAADIYHAFRSLYEQNRGPIGDAAVLDFFCSWGRVFRFFLQDVDPERMWEWTRRQKTSSSAAN